MRPALPNLLQSSWRKEEGAGLGGWSASLSLLPALPLVHCGPALLWVAYRQVVVVGIQNKTVSKELLPISFSLLFPCILEMEHSLDIFFISSACGGLSQTWWNLIVYHIGDSDKLKSPILTLLTLV